MTGALQQFLRRREVEGNSTLIRWETLEDYNRRHPGRVMWFDAEMFWRLFLEPLPEEQRRALIEGSWDTHENDPSLIDVHHSEASYQRSCEKHQREKGASGDPIPDK